MYGVMGNEAILRHSVSMKIKSTGNSTGHSVLQNSPSLIWSGPSISIHEDPAQTARIWAGLCSHICHIWQEI